MPQPDGTITHRELTRRAIRTDFVDDITVRESENPILVFGLRRDRGRRFRAIPAAVQSIENNLSISNMDFAEFADAVDQDGVFRGF